MADSWFYTHEGKTYGPAPTAALRLLAAGGKLAPTDPVWAEGHSPVTAVLAGTVIPFRGPGAPRAVPEWLADVRTAEQGAAPPAGPAAPGGRGRGGRAEGPAPRAARPRHPPPLAQRVGRPAAQAPPPLAVPVAMPVPAGPGQGRLEVGGATSPGVVRERNEDSF